MKQIVLFNPTDNDYIVLGEGARLYDVINHPSVYVYNIEGQLVHTSEVLCFHNNGFETLNTRYIHVQREKVA